MARIQVQVMKSGKKRYILILPKDWCENKGIEQGKNRASVMDGGPVAGVDGRLIIDVKRL